jgi:hypothetical protein
MTKIDYYVASSYLTLAFGIENNMYWTFSIYINIVHMLKYTFGKYSHISVHQNAIIMHHTIYQNISEFVVNSSNDNFRAPFLHATAVTGMEKTM